MSLPPPLMTCDPGSFARQTIVARKPRIIHRVLEENDYPPAIVRAVDTFRDEIAAGAIQPLREEAGDVKAWNREVAARAGRRWLEVEWYFAETYFYRRLLEAVRYFQPGPWEGRDPFGPQKRQQEAEAVARLAGGWGNLAGMADEAAAFDALLHAALWGNRADLSNYTVRVRARSLPAAGDERANVLVDHTDRVRALLAGGAERVDFVNDNVGLDLLFDLALADFLLARGWVGQVVFHLKSHPFFVSDAMVADARAALALLEGADEAAVRDLGARLGEHVEGERLALRDDPFWTTCHHFRRMPAPLREELAQAGLVVLKGDVNYRRLLDDRHWPPTARLGEIAACFPAPLLVLRTLKGEIVVGLQPGQAEALAAEDADWLINGKRGLIQLCPVQ